mgnify:CR=1 FL=1
MVGIHPCVEVLSSRSAFSMRTRPRFFKRETGALFFGGQLRCLGRADAQETTVEPPSALVTCRPARLFPPLEGSGFIARWTSGLRYLKKEAARCSSQGPLRVMGF